MEKDIILKVDNLNVKFGREKVIKDLSFEVRETEVLIILGPNGAGKTTLLRALLGVIPYTGVVRWNTRDISYLPPQEFFHRNDLPPLSVREFFRFKKASDNQIVRIFESVGLKSSMLKKEFSALSTGQFQRVMIAWGDITSALPIHGLRGA